MSFSIEVATTMREDGRENIVKRRGWRLNDGGGKTFTPSSVAHHHKRTVKLREHFEVARISFMSIMAKLFLLLLTANSKIEFHCHHCVNYNFSLRVRVDEGEC